MFSRSSNGTGKGNGSGPSVPAKPAAPSIVSRDLRVVGDLVSDGEVQVDGVLDGDIKAKAVLIGEGGHVDGAVDADTVRVHGTVVGQIRARSVTLAKSARVTGDVHHEVLAIEQGAFLEGHCKRIAVDGGDGRINLVVRDGREAGGDDGEADSPTGTAKAAADAPRNVAGAGG